jgi:Helicase associated domain
MNEMMPPEEAPGPERQQEEGTTKADDIFLGGEVEEFDVGTTPVDEDAEEMGQAGAGADGAEKEDVKMEGVDGVTAEESAEGFDHTLQTESSDAVGAPLSVDPVNESVKEEPAELQQQEQDSKPAAEETNEVTGRARDGLEDEQPKRKRIRRVGMTPVREIPKTEEGPESHDPTANGDVPVPFLALTETSTERIEGEMKLGGEMKQGVEQEQVKEEDTVDGETQIAGGEGSDTNGVIESKPAVAEETKPTIDDETVVGGPTPNTPIPGTYADGVYISSTGTRVLSKHDEKWRNMFEKLVKYMDLNGNTAVPQCFHDDPQLGRWVHYQRVEYWIYQQTGSGKITDARINRLNSIGFEWNPQQVCSHMAENPTVPHGFRLSY